MKGVRIPKERIAVLIGVNGGTKEFIESRLSVKLNIDAEGEVTVVEENAQDPLAVLKVLDVVKAMLTGKKAALFDVNKRAVEIGAEFVGALKK